MDCGVQSVNELIQQNPSFLLRVVEQIKVPAASARESVHPATGKTADPDDDQC
jgi:hypothetical protein